MPERHNLYGNSLDFKLNIWKKKNIWLYVIYDDSGDNVPFQMIWNCFCASNCTNCTKLLRFVSISPEIAPLSKFPDQYKHLRYLSFHQFLLECKRLKKPQYFSNAHIWFFKKEIQHGFLHFAWFSAGWYFQLVNIFHFFFMFSMFSKLTPGSPIQGGRMEQF